MKSETKQYLERAFLAEKFFRSIDWQGEQNIHLCWSSTLLFYSAIHYFNAFICETSGVASIPRKHQKYYDKEKGVEVEGRTEMAVRLLKVSLPTGGVQEAGTAYENLYKMSQNTRYEIGGQFFTEPEFNQVQGNFKKVKYLCLYELGCDVEDKNSGTSGLVSIITKNRKDIEATILSL